MSTSSPPCQDCQGPTHRVQAVTVRSLVQRQLVDAVPDEVFRYCPSKTCDVVYACDTVCFRRSDLKVRVGEKETDPPTPVCYCFGWTEEDIDREIEATGATSIPDRIRRGIDTGQCRCETMHPRGVCCLGEVASAVESARSRHPPNAGSSGPC